MCTYIKIFSVSRYIALTASVKFRKSSPKQLGMNKFVRTKSPTGSKFFTIFFEPLYAGWTVRSCAPMLRFFSMASDGATRERQI